jgi:NADH/NAD ratio-sensing transcriptional regulator Rex
MLAAASWNSKSLIRNTFSTDGRSGRRGVSGYVFTHLLACIGDMTALVGIDKTFRVTLVYIYTGFMALAYSTT